MKKELGLCLTILMLALPIPLLAQGTGTQIELTPSNPTAADNISYKISGVWANGCIPQNPQVSLSGSLVRIGTSNPSQTCTQALTPWALSGSIGILAAGAYDLIIEYTGAGSPAPVTEIARMSFPVSGTQTASEIFFPVVVNGSLQQKLFYQTIFTVLNTSTQVITATLQIYDNAGKPAGVFCSPLAPPPSTRTAILKPNAQMFQFTSADLPFLNGWARLRWDGSAPALASEEISLIASTPSPCLLVCNRPSTEKLASAQMSAVKAAREFRLPVTINANRQTALALINPSPTDTATVKLSILDAAGEAANLGVPGTFDIRIGPLERVSKFLWQMGLEHSALTVIVPTPESFQGEVILSADMPLVVGSLNIMMPEGKFVAVPVVSTAP